VDDYLSEKEQWEQLKGWLRANGPWIIAGIAFGALLLAGYRWWEARTDRLALEAGAKYQQLLEALDRGDKTRAQTLTADLERDYASSPYVDQAHLVAARVAVEAGQLDKAADMLKSVMEKTKDGQLALIARLRLARVQLARNKPDEALATLNAVDAGAFKPRYQEARGDVLFAKGDKAGALKEYRAAREGAVSQSVDAQTLDLKIDDLLADNITATAPQVEASAQPAEAK
jgi:predicted negative regulator of RcsB-dependent stress response